VTASGVPVYNVSMPMLTRLFPDRPPFRVFDVTLEEPVHAAPSPGRRATDPILS
jgi:hypothetical protein